VRAPHLPQPLDVGVELDRAPRAYHFAIGPEPISCGGPSSPTCSHVLAVGERMVVLATIEDSAQQGIAFVDHHDQHE